MKRNVLLLTATALSALILTGCDGTQKASSTQPQPPISSTVQQELEVTWAGIENVTLTIGDVFDPLAGVTATDSTGASLTVTVDAENSDIVDTSYKGTSTVQYVTTDSNGYKHTQTRNVTVIQGHTISNGTFDKNITGWTLDDNTSAGATKAYDNGAAKITIKATGNEVWKVQFYQTGLMFDANSIYELSFKAKSPDHRSIAGGFENVSAGYSMMYPGFTSIMLGDDYTTYKMYCTTKEAVANVKAVILLGRACSVDEGATKDKPHTVYIDDVAVKKIEANKTGVVFENTETKTINVIDQVASLPKVTAKDSTGKDITDDLKVIGIVPDSFEETCTQTSFAQIYTYTDKDGNLSFAYRNVNYKDTSTVRPNEYNPLNGDFTYGFKGWTPEANPGAVSDGKIALETKAENGMVTMDFTTMKSGLPDWNAQLWQNGITLDVGYVYTVKVTAKTSRELGDGEIIRIEFDGDKHKTDITGASAAADNKLGTEMKTVVSKEYTPATKKTNVRLGLLLAEAANPYSITIDKIEITRVVDTKVRVNPYNPLNNDFASGFAEWNTETNPDSVRDGKLAMTTSSDAAAGTATMNFTTLKDGLEDWRAQLWQSGITLEKGYTYTVKVTAKTSRALGDGEIIRIEFDGPSHKTDISGSTAAADNRLGTEMKTVVSNPYTPTETRNDVRLGLLLADVDAPYSITFDKIEIVRVAVAA